MVLLYSLIEQRGGPTETCERCAGHVKIIVEASNRCIEAPAVIERTLAQLKSKAPTIAMLGLGASEAWAYLP